MAIYVITGAATGIGAALAQLLQTQGHQTFSIDIKQADIQADLSQAGQRRAAVAEIQNTFPDGIDGFILCAGLGPAARPLSLITQVNYFACIDLCQQLAPLLAKRQGKIVLVASSSASMGGLNPEYIEALLNLDEDRACSLIETLDGHNAYAGSKHALVRWMRRNNAHFAQQGINLNAIAPGITQTPLTDKVMADAELGQLMQDFANSVPLGKQAQPEEIAAVIEFLLSPAAAYLSGSVLFADGGMDAMLRPDEF